MIWPVWKSSLAWVWTASNFDVDLDSILDLTRATEALFRSASSSFLWASPEYGRSTRTCPYFKITDRWSSPNHQFRQRSVSDEVPPFVACRQLTLLHREGLGVRLRHLHLSFIVSESSLIFLLFSFLHSKLHSRTSLAWENHFCRPSHQL